MQFVLHLGDLSTPPPQLAKGWFLRHRGPGLKPREGRMGVRNSGYVLGSFAPVDTKE